MKSIFLSILIFIGVFLFAKSDVLAVVSEKWFDYVSYGVLAVVILCGIFASFIYKPKHSTVSTDSENTGENVSEQQKEENDGD